MIDTGSREVPVTFKFKFELDMDYQGFTEGHMVYQDSYREALERLMRLRQVCYQIERLFAKAEFAAEFDPATGRLSLTYPDMYDTPFGHIEVRSLADDYQPKPKRSRKRKTK